MWIIDFLLVYSFFSFLLSLTYTYHPSTVAQTVKNPPAVQETRVRSLGQEDPLEWQPTPVVLHGEFHGQRRLEGYNP